MEVIDCGKYVKAASYWESDFYYSVVGPLRVNSLDYRGQAGRMMPMDWLVFSYLTSCRLHPGTLFYQ